MFVHDDVIHQYIHLLKTYNTNTNIYSKQAYGQLTSHIQDSLNLAHYLQNTDYHVDMGSGAGLPGIVLALATDATVVCIESKEKKRAFLRHAKQALALDNLHIFDGDVQAFASSHRGPTITSFSAKAFAKPPKLLQYLSLFRPHLYTEDAICWVPISKIQRSYLATFDTVVSTTVGNQTFYYFKIQMGLYRRYKAGLKKQYDL